MSAQPNKAKAPPAASVAMEPDTERYMQLVNWLWELGCCWRCRHVIALAQMDKEITKAPFKVNPTCETAKECREAARSGWASMPAKKA